MENHMNQPDRYTKTVIVGVKRLRWWNKWWHNWCFRRRYLGRELILYGQKRVITEYNGHTHTATVTVDEEE